MKLADEMTVTLPEELAHLVRAEVETGRFASDSAVIENALRQHYAARQRAELDRALDIGIADLDAGRSLPLAEAFREVRASLARE